MSDPEAWSELPAPSPLERLLREPHLFPLDQAVLVLAAGGDPLSLKYRTQARTGHPAGEIARARPDLRELTVTTFGLVGPGGTLPRHFTAMVAADLRRRAPASHALMDLLAQRFTGLFVKAGWKYRPARNPEPAARALAAAIGIGGTHLAGRLAVSDGILMHHAGLLASRTRSAERLRAMLAEEVGAPVSIEEFQGGWLALPASERSRLAEPGAPAGQHARLGQGAVLGGQVWDPQRRFVLRIGPLDRRRFEALLPGTRLHARLVDLTRLHVGPDQDFALNPRLDPRDVAPLRLGGGARLGWTSWLGGKGGPRRGTEAVFAAPVGGGPAHKPTGNRAA